MFYLYLTTTRDLDGRGLHDRFLDTRVTSDD
jgi:hypothetical protein